MIVLACRFRSEEGECLLENKPCDGCKDAPAFINFEEDYDRSKSELARLYGILAKQPKKEG